MRNDKPNERIIIALCLAIYLFMAAFGRGSYWDAYHPVDLFFILATFPAIFLLNTYIFIPRLAKKLDWVWYFAALLLLLAAIEGLRVFFKPGQGFFPFRSPGVSGSFTIGVLCSWLFASVKDWIANLRTIERLQNEKLQIELNFLKSQLDPHFLFNSLNSIYAVALEEKAEKTAGSIIMLSSLMRYNLHDSNQAKVPLRKELDYIEKYIALQQLRLNEDNEVDLDIGDPGPGDLQIAPFILIPFVENVFKYGVSPSRPTAIEIRISFSGKAIRLKTVNDIVEAGSKPRPGGIGLTNAKRRLELIYPSQFQLNAFRENNKYITDLSLAIP